MKKFSHKRHIVKSISWRVVGTLDTMLLGWLLSGNAMTGVKVGALELLTKIFLYYLHERVWYRYLVFEKLESRIRHIFKAISWRIIGTLDTTLLGFIVTGSFKLGLKIGGLELLTKTILYYIHERVWYRSDFGLIKEEIKNE
jgi:uncharacterized membrane protein